MTDDVRQPDHDEPEASPIRPANPLSYGTTELATHSVASKVWQLAWGLGTGGVIFATACAIFQKAHGDGDVIVACAILLAQILAGIILLCFRRMHRYGRGVLASLPVGLIVVYTIAEIADRW